MGTTNGARRVCISCRWFAAARRIEAFDRVVWKDGTEGRCQHRRSPTWNANKQALMSCRSWQGLGGTSDV